MSTADVVRIHKHGGPEEMKFEQMELDAPSAGQVRVRHTAIGLNFIDVYTRTGLYPGPTPAVLGVEAAGVVEALGDGVQLAVDANHCFTVPQAIKLGREMEKLGRDAIRHLRKRLPGAVVMV